MVKIFARGKGGGKSAVDYLTGKDRERAGARVLSGDPDTVRELIDGLDFARNYTSGVLSFAEAPDHLSEADKSDIMARFEECLFAGLDGDQYSILWVEHRDKGRLELNFLIPNVELGSGKRLQPYYDRADRPRVNDLKNLINHEYRLADPDDPMRRRSVVTAKDLPRDKKQAVETITQGLEAMIATGAIQNRADIVKTLENAGYEVVRQVKGSISIADPDGGKNIRLQGGIYEQAFRAGRDYAERIRAAGRAYAADAAQRHAATQTSYRKRLERAAQRHRQQYPRQQRSSEQSPARPHDRATETDRAAVVDNQRAGHTRGGADVGLERMARQAGAGIPAPSGERESARGSYRELHREKRHKHREMRESQNGDAMGWREEGDGIHGNLALKGAEHDGNRKAIAERIGAATRGAQRDRAGAERADGQTGTTYRATGEQSKRTRATIAELAERQAGVRAAIARLGEHAGRLKALVTEKIRAVRQQRSRGRGYEP